MQKRDLVFFSLLIFSVLFIAGCQETVGGSNVQTSGSWEYTTVNNQYSSGQDRFKFDVTVQQGGSCITLSSSVQVGKIVAIDSRDSENYLVIGCISSTVDPTSGTIGGKTVNNVVRSGASTPGVVSASQFTRAMLLQLDQRLVVPETVLSSSEVFVVRGSVASTGF